LCNHPPQVSVIIPAYNQGRFLKDAILSVLAQTHHDYEIILVDDGSTDDTRLVAGQFGDQIHYIYQDNRGLGGARNTGIQQAQGIYLALLDSDDSWLPNFLQTMMDLADKNPDVSVFYCGVKCMDSEGHTLPQILNSKILPASQFFKTLVSGNFLIPSSIVMRRSEVINAGLFDQTTSELHGCEDWDLWLRLGSQHHFLGSEECLVQYRIHGNSLSADPSKMQRAVKAVIEKHFGPDDGCSDRWTELKKLAYGGVYRYFAYTSVLRENDWNKCAQHLMNALISDPTTGTNIDFFYELALGAQPIGYRGTSSYLEIEKNAKALFQLLSELFRSPMKKLKGKELRQVYGTASLAVGIIAYNSNQRSMSRKYFLYSIFYRPAFIFNKLVIGDLFKSFFSESLIAFLRKRKGFLSSPD
jgi:glycosyltransferase involved in cell wall biosynthesis